MNNLIKVLVTAVVVCLFFACRAENKADHGNERIVSLSPHITEIIYQLGVDSLLVAVTDFCRYPPAAAEKEKIGGLIDPNIEKIVSLRPTCLFGVPAHAELDQKLRRFGLKIDMYPNETWQDLLATIDRVAVRIGFRQRGRVLIARLARTLDSLKTTAEERKPGVMLLIGHDKGTLRNATVAGPATFISEMLAVAGGRNIYEDLDVHYGTVSIESMLARRPEVIIDLKMEDNPGIRRLGADDPAWGVLDRTPAVRYGNIFSISGNYTMIPGPRMIRLAEDFRAVLDSSGIVRAKNSIPSTGM